MREIYCALLGTLPIVLFFILMKLFFNTLRHPKLTTSEKGKLKKISCNPSIFSKTSYQEYYYDDCHLYEIKDNVTNKIHLSKIIEIRPGYTKINNRRNWSVTYRKNGLERQVKFFHNLSFFNHDFAGFLATVKQANSEAKVKKLSFFTL